MAFLEQDQAPYIFHVRSPLYIRALALPLVAIVAWPIAYLYCKLGASGIEALVSRSIGDFAFWFVIVAMVLALAFALWILLPPRGTLARFEFTHEQIRYVPNFIARSMGETAELADISTTTSEVLLCYRVGRGQLPGYRIVVRSANGDERELAGHSAQTQVPLKPSEVDCLADTMSPATGLPVRVITRRNSTNGPVEEVSGIPPASKTGAVMGIGALGGALPYAAGIFMGWLSPGLAIVAAVGLVLWICIMLSLYFVGRTGPDRKKFPALRAFTTLITFGAAYGVSFVVTAYLRGRL